MQEFLQLFILLISYRLLCSDIKLCVHLIKDSLNELLLGHSGLLATTLLTHSNETLSSLLLANDNHIRDTAQLVITNLTANLLVTVVNDCSYAGVVEVSLKLLGIVVILL